MLKFQGSSGKKIFLPCITEKDYKPEYTEFLQSIKKKIMGRIQRNKSQGMIVANVYINIYIRLLNLISYKKMQIKRNCFS